MDPAIREVIEGRSRWCVVEGDCLDVVRSIPSSSFAACVMDPPYCSGARTEKAKATRAEGMVRGPRWGNHVIDGDRMTTTGFVWMMRSLAMALSSRLTAQGSLLSFIDWRQWPNLVAALESVNFRVNAMVVWDKESFGLGKGFRLQHELICWASNGTPRVSAFNVPNILRHKRVPTDDHPSPKPVPLMEDLLRVVSEPDEVVFDPFAGAGATGVAALRLGRRCVMVEREPEFAQRARDRMRAEEAQLAERVKSASQLPLHLLTTF